MVNMVNLKHVVLLTLILISVEFIGNWVWINTPKDLIIVGLIIAVLVLGAGLYFHVLKE